MCGIVGITNNKNASQILYQCLFSVQHRGQESCGAAMSSKESLRGQGLIENVFRKQVLEGTSGIAHVRYSTTGGSGTANIQPIVSESRFGFIAIAHNGNFTNAIELTESLKKQGAIFQSTTDTEIVIHLMTHQATDDIEKAFISALEQIKGAYSLLLLTSEKLFVARDSFGFRPLVTGTLDDSFLFASETCAFDIVGAKYEREVQPGEVIIIDLKDNSLKSQFPWKKQPRKSCVFEHIYFSRPDSEIFGKKIYERRKTLGKLLAKHDNTEADLVIPIPDSGIVAALGYAEEVKIPFEIGLIRSHYIQRSFIQPTQEKRLNATQLKYGVVSNVSGRRLIVIDDSLVRGTTSRQIVKMLRHAGAKEVHFRVACPPTKYRCLYGIDIPNEENLIASKMSIDEIRSYICADSLMYLPLNLLKDFSGSGYCDACFSGDCPF